MPLVKPPQDYADGRRGHRPHRRTSVRPNAPRWCKQSLDICEKKGVVGAGYIPKMHWTQATANSEGLFCLLPVRRGELHPDLPHAGRHRLRLGGPDRPQGHRRLRPGADHRDRGRQGAQVAEAARDRAGRLHRDSRAAARGPLPVAAAHVDGRARRGRGPQLHGEPRGTRQDETRREAVWRQRHHPQPGQPSGAAADADRRRRPRGARRDVDREGRREESLLQPVLGAEAGQAADRHARRPEPRHGRRHDVGRGR